MKKIIFVSILLAAVCACTKVETSSQKVEKGLYPMVISVDADEDETADETKAWTYYNPTEKKFKFRWVANDKVIAFDNVCGIAGYEFVASDNKNAKATLKGTVSEESTGQIAFINPYQKNNWVKWSYTYDTKYDVANNKVTEVFIPYDYSSLPVNDLKDKSLLRVGVLPSKESENLAMYNPLSAVYFNLTGSGTHKVTTIEIFGNNCEMLAGYCDIDVSAPSAPKVVFFPTPFLSNEKGHRVAYDLFLNSSGTQLADKQYIAALAPTNFTKGLTLKFTDNYGNVAFKTSSAAQNIPVNTIKNLGTFDVDKLDWHFAMDVRFMKGAYLDRNNTTFNGEKIKTNTNTRNEQKFRLPDGSETASFYTFAPTGGEIAQYDNGLNIKGVDAYIEIPALPGKVLRKIFYRASATGGENGNPCIVRASDGYYLTAAGTFVSDAASADIWTGKATFGQFKSWSTNFAANERYRIQVTNGKESMKIMNLVLLYDDATAVSSISNSKIDDWNPGTEPDAVMY